MKAKKIHLHVENASRLDRVFETDRQRLREALARRPSLSGKLRVTIGTDGDILEKSLKTAEVLLCSSIEREDLARRAPKLRWIHAHAAFTRGSSRLLDLVNMRLLRPAKVIAP